MGRATGLARRGARPTPRRLGLALAIFLGLTIMPSVPGEAKTGGRIIVEPFEASAFPYDGMIPEKNRPFLEGPEDARYHTSPRGGQLLVSDTYSDRRSLLAIPNAFNPARPGAAILLYFHGNNASLDTVRGRQGVPRQLFESRLNAALVAPQLALNALDSSPGHFWEPGFLDAYLSEAETRLSQATRGRFSKAAFSRLPVIIVAYSGGYMPAAFSLKYARAGSRIRGVILLDALFGEPEKFEGWIAKAHRDAFFISTYSKSAADGNADVQDRLRTRGIPFATDLPRTFAPRGVTFVSTPDAEHNDFVTRAWTDDPLRQILSCLRLGGAPPHGTCSRDAPVEPEPQPEPAQISRVAPNE